MVDAIAFSTAAFQSAVAVRTDPGEPRSCAWQVIAYYYAAFFAANALMRLSGYFCVNLDARLCADLNERFSLYGLWDGATKTQLNQAVYYCSRRDADAGSIQLKSLDRVSGGVHAQFWDGFAKFIDAQKAEFSSSGMPSSDKAKAIQQIDVFRSELSRGGSSGGSWLSEIRNAVNYRFEHGLWFPYDGSVVAAQDIERFLRDVAAGNAALAASDSSVSEIERMVRIVGGLIGWLHSAIKVIAERSQRRKKMLLVDGSLVFARRLGLT